MQLGMPTRNRIVIQRQLPRITTEQRDGIGQLKPPAFVGALDDQKC